MIKRLSRRELMAAAAAACAPQLRAAADPLAGDSLYKDVVTYSSLGEHRTATETDIRTSRWLADEMRKAGYSVEMMPFRIQQFFEKKIELRVNGQTVNSFPMWWPQPTGSKPLTGALGKNIALVKIPEVRGASIVPGNEVHQAMGPVIQSGAAGIVAVTKSLTGEIVELNAMSGLEKWAVPILLVGQSDERMLDSALAQNASCSITIDGTYESDAEAFEVVAKLNRGKKTIVVSTPSSGWFHCAGERGPGIALWLGLARWAARQESEVSYTFVASSAHELHSIGIQQFVERMPPKHEDVLCWLHLGAGIATYDYKRGERGLEKQTTASPLRRLYSVAKFAPILTKAFAGLPDLKPTVTDRPGGEMVLMAEKGYPYFGFAGGSIFHHMPGDVPERITGPDILEPVGQGLLRAFASIQDLYS